MTRLLLATLSAFVLSSALPCLQGDGPPIRKRGNIYNGDIDQLVSVLNKRTRAPVRKPLGGDSVRANAQILVAMGNCHRHYFYSVATPAVSDGPLVKPSLDALFQARRADGAYGTEQGAEAVTTTGWVCDALAAMDPVGYRAEIEQGRAWLQKNGGTSPWQALVSGLLEQVRNDVFPEQLGAEAQQAVAGLRDAASPELPRVAQTLVQLVACQEANRKLDQAQDKAPAFSPAQQKAFDFLMGKQKDGVFMKHPGFTALALAALQTKPKAQRTAAEQKVIEQGLKWLLENQNADGSFGKEEVNYVTCSVVLALSKWDDAAVKPALMKAQAYVLGIQNTEQNGFQRSDRDYGSMSYGGGQNQRGDLSNLQFGIEALRNTGLPENHEALAKAVVFLQRTQNLKSVNDIKGKVPDDKGKLMDVTSGDDGGGVYYPGNSAAGYIDLPDGSRIPRSYGSMTYALLKSYTLAGVKGNDPRITALVKWLGQNWSLAENPGADPKGDEKLKYQGLFYYYMVLAQALEAAKIDKLTVAKEGGKAEEVDWRKALRAHLESTQAADGSWKNERNPRWAEGVDVLCTTYALLALGHCR